jgi:hypothetical protein
MPRRGKTPYHNNIARKDDMLNKFCKIYFVHTVPGYKLFSGYNRYLIRTGLSMQKINDILITYIDLFMKKKSSNQMRQ